MAARRKSLVDQGRIVRRNAAGKTATAKWNVFCDGLLDGPNVVAEAAQSLGLPIVGQDYHVDYDEDPRMFVADIDVQFESTIEDQDFGRGKLFTYTANYSSLALDIDGVKDRYNENPLLRAPRMRMTWQKVEESYYRDVDGFLVRNSAGDPYDPPPTRTRSMPVLEIIRNEATFAPSFAVQYVDKINTDTFFGVGARQVYCESITPGERQSLNDIEYFEVEYRFIFNEQGWDHDPLDIGFRQLINAGGVLKLVTIKDDQGVPGFRGFLLNGQGLKAPFQDEPSAKYAKDWRRQAGQLIGPFKPYKAVPFTGMGLPQVYY